MSQDNSDEDNIKNNLEHLKNAIIHDDVEMLKKLLTQNSEFPLIDGMTLLQYAAQNGSFDIAEYLLQNRDNQSKDQNEDQQNKALIIACSNGNTEIVGLLIAFGCDPNLHVEGMPSPLMTACQRNFHETVRYLLKSGACMTEISRIDIKIPSSNSSLEKFYEIFPEICNFTDEPTNILILACKKGDTDMLSRLLEQMNIQEFINTDLLLLSFKRKLIKATYKACKKKGVRSTDCPFPGIPPNFERHSYDLYEIKQRENKCEEEENSEEEGKEIEMEEMVRVVLNHGRVSHSQFYDPFYGRIAALFNSAIENNYSDISKVTKILNILIDKNLIPHDITDNLIMLLSLGQTDLVDFLLDLQLPFDVNNDILQELVNNNKLKREIKNKFYEKGVKSINRSCTPMPFGDKSFEFNPFGDFSD